MKKGILMLLIISVIFTLSSCKAKLDDQFDRSELAVENSETNDFETYFEYLSKMIEDVQSYEEMKDEENIDFHAANLVVFGDWSVEKSELTPMNIEDELKSMNLNTGSDLEDIAGNLEINGSSFIEGSEFEFSQEKQVTTYTNEDYFYYKEINTASDYQFTEFKVKVLTSGDYISERFEYKESEAVGFYDVLYSTTDTRKGVHQIAATNRNDSLSMNFTDFNYVSGEYKAISMYDLGLKHVDYNLVILNDNKRMKTRFVKNVVGIGTAVFEVSGFATDNDRIYKYREMHEQTGNIRKNLTYFLTEVNGWTSIEKSVMMNSADEINTLGSIFQDSGEFTNYLYDPLQEETFLSPHEGISIDVDYNQFESTLNDFKLSGEDYGYDEEGNLTYAGVEYSTFDGLLDEFYKDIPEEYKMMLGLDE